MLPVAENSRSARALTVALSILVVTAFVAAACGGGPGDPEGRTWTLVELRGAPALEGTLVTLTFSDGTVNGSGGCNDYAAPATWENGDLAIEGVVASTRRACAADVMEQEAAVLAMLSDATGYTVDGDHLRLLDAGDEVSARFTATAS
jgi:heat shock protein HslJ